MNNNLQGISTTVIFHEMLKFCAQLVTAIHSIDIDLTSNFQMLGDQFVITLLPYLPAVIIQNIRDIIQLTVQWTPSLLKDTLQIMSTIFSPTVIIKQMAFTGVIQATLLSSHVLKHTLDYIKSIIFKKVNRKRKHLYCVLLN